MDEGPLNREVAEPPVPPLVEPEKVVVPNAHDIVLRGQLRHATAQVRTSPGAAEGGVGRRVACGSARVGGRMSWVNGSEGAIAPVAHRVAFSAFVPRGAEVAAWSGGQVARSDPSTSGSRPSMPRAGRIL